MGLESLDSLAGAKPFVGTFGIDGIGGVGRSDKGKKSFNADYLKSKIDQFLMEIEPVPGDLIATSIDEIEINAVEYTKRINSSTEDRLFVSQVSKYAIAKASGFDANLRPVLYSTGQGLYRGLTKERAPEIYNTVWCVVDGGNETSPYPGHEIVKCGPFYF